MNNATARLKIRNCVKVGFQCLKRCQNIVILQANVKLSGSSAVIEKYLDLIYICFLSNNSGKEKKTRIILSQLHIEYLCGSHQRMEIQRPRRKKSALKFCEILDNIIVTGNYDGQME